MRPTVPDMLPLGAIRADGGTQVRAAIDAGTVAEYAQAMGSGAVFPPVVVFHDGETHWLADGFHRVAAARRAAIALLAATVYPGNRRDALLYACRANATHGLRRSNDDKRHAVELLLRDREWGKRSDNWIAQQCAVSQPFVSTVRAELPATSNGYKSTARIGLDGRIIDTAHIGGSWQEAQGVIPHIASPLAVLFSSASPEWYTPPDIIDRVLQVLGAIDLDPCSNSHDTPNVPARLHYTTADDGLAKSWRGRVYMNPPYGREIAEWVQKLCRAYETGSVGEAVALLPSRTDTDWFRRLRHYAICFIDGRLRFSKAKHAAPFPSMAVYLGNHVDCFTAAFADLGDTWRRFTVDRRDSEKGSEGYRSRIPELRI